MNHECKIKQVKISVAKTRCAYSKNLDKTLRLFHKGKNGGANTVLLTSHDRLGWASHRKKICRLCKHL